MAEYIRLPKGAIVYKIPDELPLDKALLIEPHAYTKHAVDMADIGAEDFVCGTVLFV